MNTETLIRQSNDLQTRHCSRGRSQSFCETSAKWPDTSLAENIKSPNMKTRMMKHISSVLLATLFVAALMQLFYAHMELKYNCDALAWQVKGENDQLMTVIGTTFERTRQDAQKIAELEAQIKVQTAQKAPIN